MVKIEEDVYSNTHVIHKRSDLNSVISVMPLK
jgi:hypothetical protein